jgi:hypothetical protein
MAIERSNSFHLLLSDDELKLLKLLAEREGLNASDYLRTLIRSMPSTGAPVRQGMHIAAALTGKNVIDLVESYRTLQAANEAVSEPKKKRAK